MHPFLPSSDESSIPPGSDPPMRVLRSGCPLLVVAILLCEFVSSCGISQASTKDEDKSAKELLKVAPPDATLVITVEGLRDHLRVIRSSPLASNLSQLPAIQDWFASDQYRSFEKSCADIEAGLGLKLSELRDDLIGDAVVLVLRLDPQALLDPSHARGLLLLRAHNPDLLERLIARVNATQQGSGELEQVTDFRRGQTTYRRRKFPLASGRPPEWYVSYSDGTFGFSNSEALIHGVMDRKAFFETKKTGNKQSRAAKQDGATNVPDDLGLGDLAKFETLRGLMPERAVARIFVDPRAIEGILAKIPRSNQPSDIRLVSMLEQYLAAVQYGGAALTWNSDAVVLHTVETTNPSRLSSWLSRLAGNSRSGNPVMRRVPPTALALASMHVDALAIREAVFQLMPPASQPVANNLESIASGLLLGQDLCKRILPSVGPGFVAYIDSVLDQPGTGEKPGMSPAQASMFPVVVVLGLSQAPVALPEGGRESHKWQSTAPLADALENAFRTILYLAAMDEKRGGGRARIVTREVSGSSVTSLDVPFPFSYALDRNQQRLVLGSSSAAVARYLKCSTDPKAGQRFRDLQAVAFANTETFACIDLDALVRLADLYRGRLIKNLSVSQKRPVSDVDRDLDHVLAVARLFQAVFTTMRIEANATAVHRSIGVILHRESSL